MKELVEYIVRALVDHPDDVRITEVEPRDRAADRLYTRRVQHELRLTVVRAAIACCKARDERADRAECPNVHGIVSTPSRCAARRSRRSTFAIA